MSTIEAKKVVKRYVERLKEERYPISAVYLFGSFVHGHPHAGSDIDVAIVSTELSRGHIRGRRTLWRVSEGVDMRIEPHGFSPEEFKQDWIPMVHEIKKTGIRIA